MNEDLESNKTKLCPRCGGRKKLYKSAVGYSWENFGGILSDCPFCSGSGRISVLTSDQVAAINDGLGVNADEKEVIGLQDRKNGNAEDDSGAIKKKRGRPKKIKLDG